MAGGGEKALACAVILQWMEDFKEAYYKKMKGFVLKEEEEDTLKWLDTEFADFWCEIAEIDKYWLRKWKERIEQDIQKRIRGEGQWLKGQYTTQRSSLLNQCSVLSLPRRQY